MTRGTAASGSARPRRDVEREIDAECKVLISEGCNRSVVEHARQDTIEVGGDVLCLLGFERFRADLCKIAQNEQEPPARSDVDLLRRFLDLVGATSGAASRRGALWEFFLRLRRLDGPHESDLKLVDGGSMRAEIRKLRRLHRDLQRFAKLRVPTKGIADAIADEISVVRIQRAVLEGSIDDVDSEPKLVDEDVGDPHRRSGPQPATQRRRRWLLPLARRLVDAGATWADVARLVVEADLHWIEDPCPMTAESYRGNGSADDRLPGIAQFSQLMRKDLVRMPMPKAHRKTPL